MTDKNLVELLKYVAEKYKKSYELNGTINSNDEIIQNIITDIPQKTREIINDDRYIIKGSAGKGKMAKSPWIGIFDKDVTTNPQKGVYVVFYLNDQTWSFSLNQGRGAIEKTISGGKKELFSILKYNSDKYREILKSRIERNSDDFNEYENHIKGTSNENGEYDGGYILLRKYGCEGLKEDVIENELSFLIRMYNKLFESGNKINSDVLSENPNNLFYRMASILETSVQLKNDEKVDLENVAEGRLKKILENNSVNNDKIKTIIDNEKLKSTEKLFEIIKILVYYIFSTDTDTDTIQDILNINDNEKKEFIECRQCLIDNYKVVCKGLNYDPEFERKVNPFIHMLLIPIDAYDINSVSPVNDIMKIYGVSYLNATYYDELRTKIKQDIYDDIETVNTTSQNDDNNLVLRMFLSIDIVNSSLYKANSVNSWAKDLSSLMNYIDTKLHLFVPQAKLWRSIGDELVYTVSITSFKMLKEVFEQFSIGYYTIINDMKSKFKNCADVNLNKETSTIDELGLKATYWVALVKKFEKTQKENEENSNGNIDSGKKEENVNGYINIEKTYESFDNSNAIEYLGIDIDTGFRISKFTYSNQIALSFELAYLLCHLTDSNINDNITIVKYELLKGVWPSHYYPIIWYYNKKMNFDQDFKDVIDYDAKIKNEIIKEYEEVVSNNISTCQNDLDKIKKDLKLGEKIEAMELSIGIIMRGE